MFIPGLLHKQKFKCFVTGKELVPGFVHIHHKKPVYSGGKDVHNNLVLINKDVHRHLHAKRTDKYGNFKNFKKLIDFLES